MEILYLSSPTLICFDSDSAGPQFSPEQQDRFNKALAEQKRAYRNQIQEAESERNELRESLDLVEKQLRTRDEADKVERQKLDAKHKRELAESQKRAEEADAKYRGLIIDQSLTSAAANGGVHNPSVFATYVRDRASMTDDGRVVVEFESTDPESGQPLKQSLSPEDVVLKMRAEPKKFGGLFRDNIVNSTAKASDGKIDPAKLSTDEYMRLRRENPKALGL